MMNRNGKRKFSHSDRMRRSFTKLVRDQDATMDNIHQAKRFLQGMDTFDSKAELLSQLEDHRNCGFRRIRELLSFVNSASDFEELFIPLLQHTLSKETSRPMFISLRNKVLMAIYSVPTFLDTIVERKVLSTMEKESAEYICSFLLAISTSFVEARNSESVASLAKELRAREDIDKACTLCNCLLVDDVPQPRPKTINSAQQRVAVWVTDDIPPGGRHDNDHRNYRDVDTVPTIEELRSDQQSWLPLATGDNAIIQDPAVRLLDKQFRLLREDSVRTMKTNIREPRRTWLKARIIGLDFAGQRKQGKVIFLVQCDAHKGVRNWSRSRDLMHGSVLAFCRAGIPIMIGVVAFREAETRGQWLNNKQGPIIGVEFQSQANFEKALIEVQRNADLNGNIIKLIEKREKVLEDTGTSTLDHQIHCLKERLETYEMIEASSSFISSQPILKSLQAMNDLPFRLELCGDRSDETDSELEYLPDILIMPGGECFHDKRCDRKSWDTDEIVADTTLDQSQADALHHAFTKRICLIQGPPGTGKTFIGGLVAQMIRLNTDESILCVCYTNHALDQFLEYMLDAGETCLVRIGGRSKSERLKSFQLRDLARHKSRTGSDGSRRIKQVDAQLHELRAGISGRIDIVNKPITWRSPNGGVRQYLLEEAINFYNYLNIQTSDGDGFTLVGSDSKSLQEDYLWRLWKKGESFPDWLLPHFQDKSVGFDEFWSQSFDDRIELISSWKSSILSLEADVLNQQINNYRGLQKEREAIQHEQDFDILSKARVIGATTTGASQYKDILSQKNSGVIIVEEAGEVLEAHVLSALQLTTKHLILIGDHKQLRPKVEDYGLTTASGSGFDLDCSLFERLVESGLPSVSLSVQHRMRPEIAEFIRRQTYPSLEDHKSVESFPNVKGVNRNVVFIDHEVSEDGLGGGDENDISLLKSKANSHEAQLCVEIVRFFLLQGYSPDQMVVLTPYLGQVKAILNLVKKQLRDATAVLGEKDQRDLEFMAGGDEDTELPDQPRENSRSIRVSSIDNFQGEEADIVVASLVRSNAHGNIGFLKEEQRVNVLMSRAKHGFFIVGSSSTLRLSRHGRLVWKPILDGLHKKKALLNGLPTLCQIHPNDQPIILSKIEQFRSLRPNGGCQRPCSYRLECGHVCPLTCHPFDRKHSDAQKRCVQPCMRVPAECSMSHPCPKLCREVCGPCDFEVGPISLECGHKLAKVKCHDARNDDSIRGLSQRCVVSVGFSFQPCGHGVETTCGNSRCSTPLCPALCGALILECNHTCTKPCSKCTGEHLCGQRCERKLFCSHPCGRLCHSAKGCPPCNQPCPVVCSHSRCPKKCHSPCSSCVEDCDWQCEHKGICPLVCGAPCTRLPCNERCKKLLRCGHRCPSVCGETCPSELFCQTCGSDDIKSQVVDMIAFTSYESHDVDMDPIVVLPCRHVFAISTLDGHLDIGQVYNKCLLSEEFRSTKPLDEATNINATPKSCPDCRSIIHSVKRYGRLLRLSELRSLERKHLLRTEQNLSLISSRANSEGSDRLQGKDLIKSLEEQKTFVLKSPMRRIFEACRKRDITDLFDVPVPPTVPLLKTLELLAQAYASLCESRNDEYYQLALAAFHDGLSLADNTKSITRGSRLRLAQCTLLIRWTPLTRQEKEEARNLLNQVEGNRLKLTNEILDQLAKLRDALENPQREVAQVLQAMNVVEGYNYGGTWSSHWYECPNGHPYFIGECGGAMEESRCIECGEVVGGRRHQLNSQNQRVRGVVRQLLGRS